MLGNKCANLLNAQGTAPWTSRCYHHGVTMLIVVLRENLHGLTLGKWRPFRHYEKVLYFYLSFFSRGQQNNISYHKTLLPWPRSRALAWVTIASSDMDAEILVEISRDSSSILIETSSIGIDRIIFLTTTLLREREVALAWLVDYYSLVSHGCWDISWNLKG